MKAISLKKASIRTRKSSSQKGKTIEEAYKKIKNMIYFHELVPGQKIIYSDLAKRLNISMTPVTQALNRLEYSNLVRYEPNKGYFVGEITETEARELYEMREALEVFIIPSIIKNLKPEDLNEIKKSFKDHLRSRDRESRRLLILKDAQFHLKMAEYGNNKVIYKQLKGALEEICLKYRPEYMGDERVNDAIREHRAILNAIEKRDVDNAMAGVKEHIRKGMESVIGSLKQRNRNILF